MSRPSGSEGAPLSFIRSFYSEMITVRVGPDKQEFCIHKQLLCSNSKYFAKALSGQFLEAQTRVVDLDDVRVVLFRILVAWLYTGKLGYESSNSTVSALDEFAQVHEALQEENPFEEEGEDEENLSVQEDDNKIDDLSNFEENNPETWTYLVLAGLFVLADRLDTAKLKRQVLDAIVKRRSEGFTIPNDSAVLYAYANTTRNSMLRRLFIHIAAYDGLFGRDHTAWNHLPVDYLTAVMVTLGRRMPEKQCSDCFLNAFDEHDIAKRAIDDMQRDEDLPPYRRNLCFYHEHEDKEEEKACRTTRESRGDSG